MVLISEIIFLCHYFLPYSYICLLFFFLEKGLSLLGYHLCNFTVTKYVDKVVAYRKSYEEQTPCGGWIPWRQCTKTFYKEEYHPITISESVNLTDCCTGYEQVGLYCSLPLNRSSEFASRPGACPEKAVEALDISCMFDLDCPEHKKCCETSKGIGCSNPVPEGTVLTTVSFHSILEGNLTKHWYNVSVLVKMDFYELSKVDPRLLSHYRLLHSMISGALWRFNAKMYHIQTMQAEPYMETVVSQVLVGLQEFVPLVNISLLLKDIVMRVSEVIDIVVQGYYFKYFNVTDFDPGSSEVLLQNRNSVLVQNLTSELQETGRPLESECYLLPIRNHIICSITNSSFEMSWNVNSMQNHSFQVEVYKDKKLIQIIETMDMKLEVSNLETGVMYTAKVSYEVCSKQILSYKNVRTDALIFGVTLRILNYNFTSQLLNTSSAEYEAFSSILMTEIRNSFSSSISALYKKGILKMHVHSLEAGSIIVRLKIVIGDLQFPRDLSAFDPMMSSLSQSHVFLLDPKNSVVEGRLFNLIANWNECASRAENDCYMFAECINTIGSYICRCKTTTDANPLRPGRNCEGEIVDPTTEMVPTPEAIGIEGLPVTNATLLFAAKSTEAITVSLRGTQKPSTLPTVQKMPASQRKSTLDLIRDNDTLSTSETADPVMTIWDNVSTSNGNLAEALLIQKEQNYSLSMLPGDSNTTIYPFVINGSGEETRPIDVLTSRNSQEDPVLNITEHLVLNHSLDQEVGKDNRSWPDEKLAKMLLPPLSSSMEHSHYALATDSAVSLQAGKIVFSNITSTSFHIAWTTSFPLNSAFQFSVFEGKHLLRDVKIQSSNMTFSRLNPGILYTVKIQVEVCGKKSKTIQRKVKTAAQKCNGTVKISNMNYRPELSNSSSEEFKNLTQLFLTEIRTSLPHNTLQKMDAGIIKMLIMNISNGSIVINFALLIPTDMDANNVTWSFLDALQNNLYLRVDNNSLSIHGKLVIYSIKMIRSFLLSSFVKTLLFSLSLSCLFHKLKHMVHNLTVKISDYDECAREETDCSPDASCYNTYGSYECNCKEGFINVNAARPGRICEGNILFSFHSRSHVVIKLLDHIYYGQNSSAHLKCYTQGETDFALLAFMASPPLRRTIVLPLTYPYTSSHEPLSSSVFTARGLENASTSTTVNKAITEPIVKVHNSPQTSSMPFATFSIKNEVHVFCELENFFITIRKDFLQKQSIPESSLYLGRPHCNVSQSNSSHVMLQAGWNECGTDVQSNTTHIIVKTILQNDMSSLGAIHLLKVASPIHCVFPNDLLTSTGYTSEGVYTIFEDLHGSGHFLTEMQLFIGNSPIPRNFSISASDNIMIEVGIQIEDSKLKVVVGKCWATPTNNSMDHLSFPFIHDSCPVPNAHTTMISNGISRKAQFKMKIFSFVNDSVVYLHCKIHVCVETPGTTCKTSCSGFRSQRSGETIAMPRTSWGPLRRSSDDLKEDKVPGLGTGYIILIVLGIFVLALGTIGFLVGRHLQKAGTYNFKIKSDYFNYQVFCD
ncbi:uromodulin-like 1 [Anolis carolinensis]|uniref:uromodulin-like 1 n=1 Tax=Anolis carolinensis TaxID=28377 RepID=UPI002F2B5780